MSELKYGPWHTVVVTQTEEDAADPEETWMDWEVDHPGCVPFTDTYTNGLTGETYSYVSDYTCALDCELEALDMYKLVDSKPGTYQMRFWEDIPTNSSWSIVEEYDNGVEVKPQCT